MLPPELHPEAPSRAWTAELLLLRGRDPAQALVRIDAIERAMASGNASPAEIARACATGHDPVQFAVVARDTFDLDTKLSALKGGARKGAGIFVAPESRNEQPKVAFLFPGQGSQRVGMLRDLFATFPALRAQLARGARWQSTIFPAEAASADDEVAQQAALTDTRVAQPALGIAGLAMAQLLALHGLRPDMLAGHSYGELVALCVAGALPEPDLLDLSELRGRRILESCAEAADAGTMAAVSAPREIVAQAIAPFDGVVIANENSPEQSVISGPTAAVEAAVAHLLEAGIAAKGFPVACAFHSPLVRGACALFAGDLASVSVTAPRLPVYSNTTASPYPGDPAAIRALLARHIGEPVHFVAEIEAMYAAGARVFVEVGPGRVLTGLVGRILGKRSHAAIACDRPGEDGLVQWLQAMGQLAVQGVAWNADALFAGRGIVAAPLGDA